LLTGGVQLLFSAAELAIHGPGTRQGIVVNFFLAPAREVVKTAQTSIQAGYMIRTWLGWRMAPRSGDRRETSYSMTFATGGIEEGRYAGYRLCFLNKDIAS